MHHITTLSVFSLESVNTKKKSHIYICVKIDMKHTAGEQGKLGILDPMPISQYRILDEMITA